MLKNISKALGGVVLFVLFSVAFAMPVMAAEQPQTISQEARYLSGQKAPGFPDQLTKDDKSYDLVGVSAPVEDKAYSRPLKEASYESDAEVSPADYARLDEIFPEQKQITDGSFAGAIPRVEYQVTPVYESLSQQVDRSQVITGLPSNEVGQIATEQVFEVRSADGIDATQEKSLKLLDVAFTVEKSDDNGRPLAWTATCAYRGEESYLELHHYEVKAKYAGQIASTVPQLVVTATYQERVEAAAAAVPVPAAPPLAAPAPAVPVPPAAPLPAPVEPAAQKMGLLPFAFGGGIAAALALGWLLLYLLLLRKNVRLVALGAKPQTIARRHLAVSRGEAHFAFPENLAVYGRDYAFQLKPRLSAQKGVLVVTYEERIILKERLAPTVQMSLAMASAVAVSDGIARELIEDEVA